MLTGQLRNDIDNLWEKFWTGGVTNPLVVIEQISYLMFSRMLDIQETQAEKKAQRTNRPFTRLFPESSEGQLLRWQNYKNMSGQELLPHLRDKVFPYFANVQLTGSDIAQFMATADLQIRSEAVTINIGQKFALADAVACHKAMEARKTVGSTLLTV